MIQPRVNQGLIALVKRGLVYFYGSAQAFGNIITGQLDVQSTRMSSGSLGDFKETTDLVHDVFEATGLVTIGRSNGIAMHRIVDPKWRSSGGFDTLHNGWQLFANGIWPIRMMKVRRPGSRLGSSFSTSSIASSTVVVGPSF